ncbi:hypothetical protein RB621_37040, partial [Streptomyces californicus]|nr:hypothetical protein [Streptomyces californicus]
MTSAAPGTVHDPDPSEGIRVIRYADGHRTQTGEGWRQALTAVRTAGPREHADGAHASPQDRSRGDFLWLALHSPTPGLLTEIAHTFGLHELAVEDTTDT